MISRRGTIVALKVASGLTILCGLMALAGSLVSAQVVKAFGVPMPGWLIAGAVTYCGLRYWFRLAKLEQQLKIGNNG